MRIRTFILATSAAVAVGFFGISYYTLGRVLDHGVRSNALDSSNTLAQVTFSSMYQVMSTGWRRPQVEEFIASLHKAAKGTPTQVEIYRGPKVEAEYGKITQPPFDAQIEAVFADGKAFTESPEGGVRYLMPLVAGGRCMRCHEEAEEGDVLGVIEVKQDFGPLLEQSRRDFIL